MSQNGCIVTLVTPRADGQGKEYRVMHMDSDHFDGEFVSRCEWVGGRKQELRYWSPSDEEKIESARKLFVGKYCHLFATEDEAYDAVDKYYDDKDHYIEYGPVLLEINVPF